MARLTRGGPRLPYDLLAGIEPCPAGWLVVSAKLQGTTISAQEPEVFERFTQVIDYRPPFAVMAIHLPLGLPDHHEVGGRECDRAARRLLGWPRSAAVASPPSWEEVQRWRGHPGLAAGLSAVTRSLMPKILDAYEHLGSYHQRTLYEVHPELGFYQLNSDVPLRYSKHTRLGIDERTGLLSNRIPGIERVIRYRHPGVHTTHLLDAAADLWTARRILARGVSRLPENPVWDDQGLRMEMVR